MRLYILHFATLVNQLSTSSIAKLTSLSLELNLFTLSCRYLTVQTSRPSLTQSCGRSFEYFSAWQNQETGVVQQYRSSYNLGLVLSHTIAALINIACSEAVMKRPQLFCCKLALNAADSSLPSSPSLMTRSS